MSPFVAPSGGDWSAHVGGAVVFNGTEGCTLSTSTIESVGGSGVALTGYNRGATISDNEFAWLGEAAIVSVGLVGNTIDGGQSGNFPEGTLIEGNLGHEVGVFVKQTGFYYAGVSANATLIRNIFFNGPRAGININDGFAGGHYIHNNVGFNFVRETSDHGQLFNCSALIVLQTHARNCYMYVHVCVFFSLLTLGVYNSWDREPYHWDSSNASVVDPLPIVIDQNLFVNNYASSWPIDNDDGSNGCVLMSIRLYHLSNIAVC